MLQRKRNADVKYNFEYLKILYDERQNFNKKVIVGGCVPQAERNLSGLEKYKYSRCISNK